MASPSHAFDFRDGEHRFVFAARRDGGLLFELPDGEADGVRVWAKANLMCPIVGCREPTITTVNRGEWGRDGFRHQASDVEHRPERWFHMEGKRVMAAWARTLYPKANVVEELPSNAQRERIADVMVTLPNGLRAALEVQYSPLSIEAWQERHDSYVRQGILDVWVFGHTGEQLKLIGGGARTRLSGLHEHVVRNRVPLLWLNPISSMVAAPRSVRRTVERRRAVGPRAYDTHADHGEHDLIVEPLQAFEMFDRGMLSPRLRKVEDSHRDYLDAAAEHAREAAAREAIRLAEREAEKANVRRAAEEEVRRTKEHERRRKVLNNDWLASTEAAEVVQRFRGSLPRWLGVDFQIGDVATREWQWHVFTHQVDAAAPGARTPLQDAAESLQQRYGDRLVPDKDLLLVIRAWYAVLAREGYLVEAPVANAFKTGHRVFYRPVARRIPMRDGSPSPAVQAEVDRRARIVGARKGVSSDARNPGSPSPVDAHPRLSVSPTQSCRQCTLPLDEALASTGIHIGCALGLGSHGPR